MNINIIIRLKKDVPAEITGWSIDKINDYIDQMDKDIRQKLGISPDYKISIDISGESKGRLWMWRKSNDLVKPC